MRRYLLFAGEHYYPGGGWLDFVGAYLSVYRAKAAKLPKDSEWAHVIDSKTGNEVGVWEAGLGWFDDRDALQQASDKAWERRTRPAIASLGFMPTSALIAPMATGFPVAWPQGGGTAFAPIIASPATSLPEGSYWVTDPFTKAAIMVTPGNIATSAEELGL